MTSKPDTIDIKCQECGEKFRVPRSAIGRSGKCKCGNKLLIRDVSAEIKALGDGLQKLLAESAKRCGYHENEQAVEKCVKCEKPLCHQCAIKTRSGEFACQPCIDAYRAAKGTKIPATASQVLRKNSSGEQMYHAKVVEPTEVFEPTEIVDPVEVVEPVEVFEPAPINNGLFGVELPPQYPASNPYSTSAGLGSNFGVGSQSLAGDPWGAASSGSMSGGGNYGGFAAGEKCV